MISKIILKIIKKNSFLFLILPFFLCIINIKIYSQYYINETNVNISDKEKEYNFYAEDFYKKSEIKVYFKIFIIPKNSEYSETYMQLKKIKFQDEISKENNKYIAVLYELKSNNFYIINNLEENIIKKEELENIFCEYVNSYFDYIEYKLNNKTGEIEYKFKNIEEVFKNKNYIEDETIGMLGIGFIKGLANYINIKIDIKDKNILKISNEMKKKTSIYEKLVEKTKNEEIKIEKTEKNKLNSKEKLSFKEKNEDKEKQILKDNKSEIIEDKWKYNFNFYMAYEYTQGEMKEYNENKINPITGLLDEVYEEKKEGEFILKTAPSIYLPDKAEIKTSFKFSKYNDFNKKEDSNNFDFDYISGKYFGDTYTFVLNVGNIEMKKDSYLILNDTYRGIYGSVQYYMNYNPDKKSIQKKKLKGEIKNKENKSLKISAVTAPEKRSFGEKVNQGKINGLFIEGYLDDYELNKMLLESHFGYVYGFAEKEKEENNAQNMVLELKFKEKDTQDNYYIGFQYLDAYFKDKENKETEGERYELILNILKNFKNDYIKMRFKINYANEGLKTSILSSSYENGVPDYVNETSLIGGLGCNFYVSNTFFNKKIENRININFSEKFDSKEYKYYKEINLNNLYNLNNKNRLSYFMLYKENYSTKENIYNIVYDKNFENNIGNLDIKKGKLNLSYENRDEYNKKSSKEELKDTFRIVLKEEFCFNQNFKNNNTNNFYYKNYPKTKENYLGAGIENMLTLKEEQVYNKLKFNLYNEDIENKKYTAFYNTIQTRTSLFTKENIFFEDELTVNFNMKNYIFKQEKENILINDIYGYELFFYTPFNLKKLSSNFYIDFKKNKDNLNNINQFDNTIFLKNNYKKSDKINFYLNYIKLSRKKSGDTFSKLNNDLNVNDIDNIGIISDINSSINYISDEIKNDLKADNIETGIKYKVYSKKSDKIKNDLKLVSGVGYDKKEYSEDKKEYNYLSSYLSAGNEYILNFKEKFLLKNEFSYRYYMKKSNINSKILENLGLKYKSDFKEMFFLLNYQKENYKIKNAKIENSDYLTISSGGKFKIDKNKKNSFEYAFKSEYDLITKDKYNKLNSILKSNIISNDEKETIIDTSNIFIILNAQNNKNKEENFYNLLFNSGGEAKIRKISNKISISGGINYRKDIKNNIKENYANISLSDNQDIFKNSSITLKTDYYKLYSSSSKESASEKIAIFLIFDIKKLYYDGLKLSCNLIKNIEKNKGINLKEEKIGKINLNYTF